MKKLLFVLVLVVAIALAYYSVSIYSVKIQNDIKIRLAESFGTENISNNIQAEVDGRDVLLRGVVSEEEPKRKALQVANAIYGVRAVDNQITVVEAPPFSSYQEELDIESEPEVSAADENALFKLDIISSNEDEESDPALDLIFNEEITAPTIEALDEPSLADIGAPPPPATDLDVEPGLVSPTPAEVVDVMEEPESLAETSVASNDIDLDEPLAIVNKRIIRRNIGTAFADTSVEAACEGNLTSLLQSEKINFESGRENISPNSHDLLDRIVISAKNCHEDTIITINGYTDNEGNLEANRKLSLQRARAVGRYMLERGVAKQVKVVGNGPNDPVASNETEEGRAQNRRIEFKVFKTIDQ